MENLNKEDIYFKETKRIRKEYKRREKAIPPARYHGQGDEYLYHDRKKHTKLLFQQTGLTGLEDKRILEVGCGLGVWLHDFISWGADEKKLSGIELDLNKVDILKKRLPLGDIRAGNALELPWPDQSFDLVMQSTLFSSILNFEYKKRIAGEISRVLKPSGAVLWYDFRYNNPFNRHVQAIKLSEIHELFTGFNFLVKRVTLAPPLVRFLAYGHRGLCEGLNKIPFLRTHYLILMKKR